MLELRNWLNEFSDPNWQIFIKRLSGNDTLATGSHQVGPYIPREVLFRVFPEIQDPLRLNPDVHFEGSIDSHAVIRGLRAIWYNNKVLGSGTRDECRITRWGGSSSPVLDPESTGSICIFAFRSHGLEAPQHCHVWVCRDIAEEEVVEERYGTVEPETRMFLAPGQPELPLIRRSEDCRLTLDLIPPAWRERFPSGEQIIAKVIQLMPEPAASADIRLLRRRKCEYELFLTVEELLILPEVQKGFPSVDGFISLSSSVLNRRKSRAGKSLELHAARIFEEEQLSFTHNAVSEGGKRPDFVFPSVKDYHDPSFPPERLRMLGAKTTCKDRWRQVLNEADRIPNKHLLTLQRGVSVNQFREMSESNVTLVVPNPLKDSYPAELRPKLLSLDRFIRESKEICEGHSQ